MRFSLAGTTAPTPSPGRLTTLRNAHSTKVPLPPGASSILSPEMDSNWVIVVLTAVLVIATIWYARTTAQALEVAKSATDEARSATEEARKANLIALRGLFGAEITVSRNHAGAFIVENLGVGPAYEVLMDFQVAKTTYSPNNEDDWKPLSDAPQLVAKLILGIRQERTAYAVDVRYREFRPDPPPGFVWPDPADKEPLGGVYARARVQYNDAYRHRSVAYSDTFVLINAKPLGTP